MIAGPTSTPLDQARSILNHSTGQTGVLVAEQLQSAGLTTELWLGQGANYPLPPHLTPSHRFRTLVDLIELIGRTDLAQFHAILLPAALPDYEFDQATDPKQQPLESTKWPSSLPYIQIKLRPCFRILPLLRQRAPSAKIVGWKWEAASTPPEALLAARQQMARCQTSACVLNGPSSGAGYQLIPALGEITHCANATELGQAVARFLQS